MTRRTWVRAALILIPIGAFILYAALNWYTLEDHEIWVGASEAAKQDPYLAYTRLLERMGTPAKQARVPTALDALPARGTLILASGRLIYMTPERVRRVQQWVDRGGSLVVETEPRSIDDPLLDAFGIQRVFPKVDPDADPRKQDPRRGNAGAVVTIDWPQLGKPLKAAIGTAYGELRDTRVRSDLREVRQGERVIAMTFASGEGRVAVLPRLFIFRNERIGQNDHAELGWKLAAGQSPTVLYLRMVAAPLSDWLRNDAWPVVVAAALLLLLWLARIIPRFGPLEPDAPPVRRSLLEHVVASGRFLWARGAAGHLVEAVRERALRSARRRGVPPQRMPEELKSGTLARADASAFTQRIAALQKVEERLSQREKRT